MTKSKKDAIKIPGPKRPLPTPPEASDAPLSPQWAFLVQFRAVPGGPAYVAGRVEHLVSGRTSHFQSLKELTAYLVEALHASGQT